MNGEMCDSPYRNRITHPSHSQIAIENEGEQTWDETCISSPATTTCAGNNIADDGAQQRVSGRTLSPAPVHPSNDEGYACYSPVTPAHLYKTLSAELQARGTVSSCRLVHSGMRASESHLPEGANNESSGVFFLSAPAHDHCASSLLQSQSNTILNSDGPVHSSTSLWHQTDGVNNESSACFSPLAPVRDHGASSFSQSYSSYTASNENHVHSGIRASSSRASYADNYVGSTCFFSGAPAHHRWAPEQLVQSQPNNTMRIGGRMYSSTHANSIAHPSTKANNDSSARFSPLAPVRGLWAPSSSRTQPNHTGNNDGLTQLGVHAPPTHPSYGANNESSAYFSPLRPVREHQALSSQPERRKTMHNDGPVQLNRHASPLRPPERASNQSSVIFSPCEPVREHLALSPQSKLRNTVNNDGLVHLGLHASPLRSLNRAINQSSVSFFPFGRVREHLAFSPQLQARNTVNNDGPVHLGLHPSPFHPPDRANNQSSASFSPFGSVREHFACSSQSQLRNTVINSGPEHSGIQASALHPPDAANNQSSASFSPFGPAREYQALSSQAERRTTVNNSEVVHLGMHESPSHPPDIANNQSSASLSPFGPGREHPAFSPQSHQRSTTNNDAIPHLGMYASPTYTPSAANDGSFASFSPFAHVREHRALSSPQSQPRNTVNKDEIVRLGTRIPRLHPLDAPIIESSASFSPFGPMREHRALPSQSERRKTAHNDGPACPSPHNPLCADCCPYAENDGAKSGAHHHLSSILDSTGHSVRPSLTTDVPPSTDQLKHAPIAPNADHHVICHLPDTGVERTMRKQHEQHATGTVRVSPPRRNAEEGRSSEVNSETPCGVQHARDVSAALAHTPATTPVFMKLPDRATHHSHPASDVTNRVTHSGRIVFNPEPSSRGSSSDCISPCHAAVALDHAAGSDSLRTPSAASRDADHAFDNPSSLFHKEYTIAPGSKVRPTALRVPQIHSSHRRTTGCTPLAKASRVTPPARCPARKDTGCGAVVKKEAPDSKRTRSQRDSRTSTSEVAPPRRVDRSQQQERDSLRAVPRSFAVVNCSAKAQARATAKVVDSTTKKSARSLHLSEKRQALFSPKSARTGNSEKEVHGPERHHRSLSPQPAKNSARMNPQLAAALSSHNQLARFRSSFSCERLQPIDESVYIRTDECCSMDEVDFGNRRFHASIVLTKPSSEAHNEKHRDNVYKDSTSHSKVGQAEGLRRAVDDAMTKQALHAKLAKLSRRTVR